MTWQIETTQSEEGLHKNRLKTHGACVCLRVHAPVRTHTCVLEMGQEEKPQESKNEGNQSRGWKA